MNLISGYFSEAFIRPGVTGPLFSRLLFMYLSVYKSSMDSYTFHFFLCLQMVFRYWLNILSLWQPQLAQFRNSWSLTDIVTTAILSDLCPSTYLQASFTPPH